MSLSFWKKDTLAQGHHVACAASFALLPRRIESRKHVKTSDFDFDLPEELIAQTPLPERDSSRLLVYHRRSKTMEHRRFSDIVTYLHAGDVLVINRSRVLPARLIGARITDDGEEGGKIEFLLLRRLEGDTWECLAKPGKRAKVGVRFRFGEQLWAEVVAVGEEGNRVVTFHYNGIWEEVLDQLGEMPLPPYIHEKLEERERYQTVYSRETGSAAAPTAGLHFTNELLEQIKAKGVLVESVLLHVGLGTFRPVKVEELSEHHMHSEYCQVEPDVAERINKAKAEGGRVICVGTTSCRTLESMTDESGVLHAGGMWSEIFISPGYRFKITDALITNFHLPQSTLLMLVSALATREEMLAVYNEAVKEKYRFFSFGDAMFIE